MGVLPPGSAHHQIDICGNFPAHVSAESPSNISPNTLEVISEVLLCTRCVAHTLLWTVIQLYRCTLFQPLYTCTNMYSCLPWGSSLLGLCTLDPPLGPHERKFSGSCVCQVTFHQLLRAQIESFGILVQLLKFSTKLLKKAATAAQEGQPSLCHYVRDPSLIS